MCVCCVMGYVGVWCLCLYVYFYYDVYDVYVSEQWRREIC